MLEEITVEQAIEWMAFKRLEPWGWQMFALFFGQLCGLVMSVAGGKSKPWHYFYRPPYGFQNETMLEHEERLAFYEAEELVQSMSDEDMARDAEARAAAAASEKKGETWQEIASP